MRTLPAVLLLVPAIALADDPKPKDKPAAAPAEIKATVDAFKGNWTFDATITAPGMAKPAKFATPFNCRVIAGGNAVACDAKAKSPQGAWEASFLVGYDPHAKAVRFLQVTNQYEIRDHLCHWKGSELTCAPVKGGTGMLGEEVTDEIKMVFDKNTCTFTSTTKSKSGTTVFEGKGKR
jgi:hypothetical protein